MEETGTSFVVLEEESEKTGDELEEEAGGSGDELVEATVDLNDIEDKVDIDEDKVDNNDVTKTSDHDNPSGAPVATSTPRNSISNSESITIIEPNYRYSISALCELVDSELRDLQNTYKFKMLLGLLDDGSGTVSCSLVDTILSRCPHLFRSEYVHERSISSGK